MRSYYLVGICFSSGIVLLFFFLESGYKCTNYHSALNFAHLRIP